MARRAGSNPTRPGARATLDSFLDRPWTHKLGAANAAIAVVIATD